MTDVLVDVMLKGAIEASLQWIACSTRPSTTTDKVFVNLCPEHFAILVSTNCGLRWHYNKSMRQKSILGYREVSGIYTTNRSDTICDKRGRERNPNNRSDKTRKDDVLRLSTETVAIEWIVEDTMTTAFLAKLWRSNQKLRRAPVIESWTKCVGSTGGMICLQSSTL